MRYIRYAFMLGAIALIGSATAANAEKPEKTGKMKMPEKMNAECKMDAAQTNATCTMEQKKEQMQNMQKQQMKKTEEMKKEAGKGSEQGQAMREEHSRKWWKFWGGDEPSK